MKTLFLDDRDIRVVTFLKTHPDAVVVRCARDCIERLAQGEHWDEVWLDHDLFHQPHCRPEDSGTNNGIFVVQWIITNFPKVNRFIIHSTATREAPIMERMLRNAGYFVHWQMMEN